MDASDREELARCQTALRRTKEEVALLRNASLTFGDLADRLNREVLNLRAQLRAHDEAESGRRIPARPKRLIGGKTVAVCCVAAVGATLLVIRNR